MLYTQRMFQGAVVVSISRGVARSALNNLCLLYKNAVADFAAEGTAVYPEFDAIDSSWRRKGNRTDQFPGFVVEHAEKITNIKGNQEKKRLLAV